jgi:hypothetical protein
MIPAWHEHVIASAANSILTRTGQSPCDYAKSEGDRFVVPPRDDVVLRAFYVIASEAKQSPCDYAKSEGDRFVVPPRDDVV